MWLFAGQTYPAHSYAYSNLCSTHTHFGPYLHAYATTIYHLYNRVGG